MVGARDDTADHPSMNNTTSTPSVQSHSPQNDFSPGMGLATKLLMVVGAACSLIFVGLMVFSVTSYERQRNASLNSLLTRTQGLAASLKQIDEAGRRSAEQSFGILRDKLPLVLFSLQTVDGKDQLLNANYPVEGNPEPVDSFAFLTGGVATVFQREGDEFRRVVTSLKKPDGTRAVDTVLDHSSPAYPLVLQGKPYVGRAVLFGKSYMTKYEPIISDGKVIGILFIGQPLGQQTEMLQQSFELDSTATKTTLSVDVRDGPGLGQMFGVTNAGKLDASNPVLSVIREAIVAGKSSGLIQGADPVGLLPGQGPANVAWTYFEPWGWALVQAERDIDTMAETRADLLMLWAMIAGGAVLAAIGVFMAIRSMLLLPLRHVLKDVELLRKNDYSQPLVPPSRDELGQFIHSLETVRRQLSFNMRQMEQSARDIDSVAQEVAKGNMELGGRTDNASGSLQQTASSMEELTATVKQSADAARQANQLASTAAEVASRGGAVVSQVVTTMEDINHSSRKIADIIGVIDSIAFQTNILALNAAVEAARAGEAGRGFAVVASEVRNLAGRSAQAAKEIKDLINTSVDKVQSGSQLVQDAGKTMDEIVASVQRVTDVIGEITAASSEQSDGIGQVNTAVNQLDQMTQQNAALVEQVASAADSLSHQTMRLQEALANYKTGNDGMPDSAILRRDIPKVSGPVVHTRQADVARLPRPTPHNAASAPRLESKKTAADVKKIKANTSYQTSAERQKKVQKTTSSTGPSAGEAESTRVTKSATPIGGDWETF